MHELDSHFRRIIEGRHHDPFEVLGPHPTADGVMVRAYLPGAVEARLIRGDKRSKMRMLWKEGIFEAHADERAYHEPYEIETLDHEGRSHRFFDPYAFPPLLSDFDIHLIGEGTHYRKYEKMGAHITEVRGVKGVHFAVWAPNAQGVCVSGDFNFWDGRKHPMRVRGSSGLWELFIPRLSHGTLYKFRITTTHESLEKADPYGFFSELRPRTASVVWDMGRYKWNDADWIEQRRHRDWLSEPISIYELHLGSWMRTLEGETLTYRDLAHKLVDYVKDMGYTHIELMPLQEHPLDASWGYQVLGYFAVTSRFGTPEDFMYFVDHCHQNGIGVIMDWVPAHFPKDGHGLARFDGTFLYEHEHPFMREHQDWGTHIFNYGRKEVASFLLNSALYWLHTYHMDGLRVDAVASMLYLDYSRKDGQWLPNIYGGNENIEAIAFIKRFNELCHRECPGVLTVAEESTAWPMVSRPTYTGGLGFSLKWNMGWMHDVLEYFTKDPVYRKFHHHDLTFGLIYAFHENFVLVFSHDEVVHGKGSMIGKMPGDQWQQFANMRLLLGFMFAHPGKKMLFMGADIGQWAEWKSDSSVEWHLLEYKPHIKLQRCLRELNSLIKREPCLHELDFHYSGFEWVDYNDAGGSVISFIRKAKNPADYMLFVFNFTPVPRHGYRVGLPEAGRFQEVFNTDAGVYGGSNTGNYGEVWAEEIRHNQWQCSVSLTIPPLGMVALKPLRA